MRKLKLLKSGQKIQATPQDTPVKTADGVVIKPGMTVYALGSWRRAAGRAEVIAVNRMGAKRYYVPQIRIRLSDGVEAVIGDLLNELFASESEFNSRVRSDLLEQIAGEKESINRHTVELAELREKLRR